MDTWKMQAALSQLSFQQQINAIPKQLGLEYFPYLKLGDDHFVKDLICANPSNSVIDAYAIRNAQQDFIVFLNDTVTGWTAEFTNTSQTGHWFKLFLPFNASSHFWIESGAIPMRLILGARENPDRASFVYSPKASLLIERGYFYFEDDTTLSGKNGSNYIWRNVSSLGCLQQSSLSSVTSIITQLLSTPSNGGASEVGLVVGLGVMLPLLLIGIALFYYYYYYVSYMRLLRLQHGYYGGRESIVQ